MMEYAIVVPSRKRPYNMPMLRELLPTAIICIDEREEAEYAREVPKENLLLHPPMSGAPAVRNWMIDNVPAPCLIMLDDDFRGVVVNVGDNRTIRDSDEILAILENSVRACSELGLSTFCYSRTQNTTVIRPDERPIVPVQQVYGCFGIMNAARHRHWDENLKSRADLDNTLQVLLHDRCVYADVRFYFDFGSSFSGSGGNSGLVTAQDFADATKVVAQRWGRSISFKRPGYMKNAAQTSAGRPMVKRQNSLAKR